jgi:hypothetical protein
LTGIRPERSELTSFSQLVQELIAGVVRRHIFTSWERDLLLDFETCGIRKSARADLLRRYLRAVQQQFSIDPSPPLRLSQFVELEHQQRRRSRRTEQQTRAATAHCAS